ncbi:stalk domain-containing protein [Paenibacillus sp. J22TS3]|uniref:stalk domain-containing protein n=1 Tax=Paenibacillus sp. J22TS3 TaxID=2807192 RepID=UPI001B000234|nr:stalk domain-containing protein [Paenibacillus sp. J22TS3]GIP21960.1 hypothetical protein J22TS3_22350 [Paenibacillus sp. J22TS3]
MDFKKATLVTALIISQAAAAMPAGAEAISSQVQSGSGTGAQTQTIEAPERTAATSIPSGAADSSGSLAGTKSVGAVTTGTPANQGQTDIQGSNPSTGGQDSTFPSQPDPTNNQTNPGTTNGSNGNSGQNGSGSGDNNSLPTGQTPDGTGESPGGTIPGTTTPPQNLVPGETGTGGGQLILYMNSTRMEQDGLVYTATHAMTVKNGVSYVGIRSLVDRVGYKIAYDAKTKETIITYGGNELRFKTGSSKYRVNGVTQTMRGTAYQDKNVFMVPLTAITKALNIPYTVNGKQVIVQLSTKPVATFTVQPSQIVAGETTVKFVAKSFSPKGLDIVDERWEGRPDQDMFQSAGTYTVTYSVQDSSGQWSDPYSMKINVVNPNLPPVADFTTDKTEYKMGELVTFTDLSTDDENAIVKHDWTNKALAYFTPGPQTIQLTVTDKHGATGTVSKTINITNETLYKKDDFYKLFTPIGENMEVNSALDNYERLPYSFTTEPYTLFRDSGPESVTTEGILYQDTIQGLTRFMIHHRNRLGEKAKVYLVAKNMNATAAHIDYQTYGVAGPNKNPDLTGRLSVQRYFENYATDAKKKTVTLAPGEAKVIFEDMSALALQQEDVISLLGDLNSDAQVQYTVLIVKEKNDPIKALSTLPSLDPKESIIRGTFADSTRVFEYGDLVGNKNQRINLTSPELGDPYQTGTDGILGTPATNSGNYGVLYKIVLHRVAPHTLITFNPRGGLYRGAALVNGNIVSFSHAGANTQSQGGVLYRTKDYEEDVEIWISPSAGNNLPFALLFMPMPEMKPQS